MVLFLAVLFFCLYKLLGFGVAASHSWCFSDSSSFRFWFDTLYLLLLWVVVQGFVQVRVLVFVLVLWLVVARLCLYFGLVYGLRLRLGWF